MKKAALYWLMVLLVLFSLSSVQGSCKLDQYACCGGSLEMFADWYRQRGIAVPWANGNALFADAGRQCQTGSSAISCGSIGTTPNYVINSITPVTVPVSGNQSASITNVQNVLNQNKAIWFGFFLPEKPMTKGQAES